ncbi:hypothetical protein ACXHPE_17330, partial [Vibrio cincinnatiensis]
PVTHHRHDGVTKEYDYWCLFVSAAERLRSTRFCPKTVYLKTPDHFLMSVLDLLYLMLDYEPS